MPLTIVPRLSRVFVHEESPDAKATCVDIQVQDAQATCVDDQGDVEDDSDEGVEGKRIRVIDDRDKASGEAGNEGTRECPMSELNERNAQESDSRREQGSAGVQKLQQTAPAFGIQGADDHQPKDQHDHKERPRKHLVAGIPVDDPKSRERVRQRDSVTAATLTGGLCQGGGARTSSSGEARRVRKPQSLMAIMSAKDTADDSVRKKASQTSADMRMLKMAIGAREEVVLRAPPGAVAGGFFRVLLNGFDLTLRLHPEWQPGMAVRLVRPVLFLTDPDAVARTATLAKPKISLTLATFPRGPPAENCEEFASGAEIACSMQAEPAKATASADARCWEVTVPKLIAGVARMTLPVLLCAGETRYCAITCPDGARCGVRYTCRFLQAELGLALTPRSVNEFECLVPYDAKAGQPLCVHSTDGMQVLTFTLPSELNPRSLVRVVLS